MGCIHTRRHSQCYWLASKQLLLYTCAVACSMRLTWVLVLFTGPYRYAMRGSVVAFAAVA